MFRIIRNIHCKIFKFLKFKEFMKPFVILFEFALVCFCVVHLVVARDIMYVFSTLLYTTINFILLHFGLKLWEIIFVFLAKLTKHKL